jgi:hypothetical protein
MVRYINLSFVCIRENQKLVGVQAGLNEDQLKLVRLNPRGLKGIGKNWIVGMKPTILERLVL